MTHHQQKDLQ
ncbi:hypothetical protein LINPERPRIM_LOCUS29941 [Linum perenne]